MVRDLQMEVKIMINTTFNVSYNMKERESIYSDYLDLKHQQEAIDAKMDQDGISDEEWDRLMEEYEAISEKKHAVWYKGFAAQFRNVKNQWFTNVIANFADGEYHRISEKQYTAFKRYAGQDDQDSWKTGETYCRCNGYFVTLTWKNYFRGIKVEMLT